jgi:uncharacterized protein (DUF342 family)
MILADKINNLEKEINTKPDELQQLKPKLQNLKNKFEGNYYYCCNSFMENLVYIQSVHDYSGKFLHVAAVSIAIDTSNKLLITVKDIVLHENDLTLITEKEFIEKYNTWKIQFQNILDKILPNHKTIINI